MRVLLPLLTVGVLAVATSLAPARAGDTDIMAGRSTTSGGRWTNTVFVNHGFGHFDWGGMHLQPVGTLGWIQSRSTHDDNLNHNVYVAGGGLRLTRFWHGMFASFQVGVAAGRTDAISSAPQFISSVGWHGTHWAVMARHISNGDFFGGRNLGETMLTVGVRF